MTLGKCGSATWDWDSARAVDGLIAGELRPLYEAEDDGVFLRAGREQPSDDAVYSSISTAGAQVLVCRVMPALTLSLPLCAHLTCPNAPWVHKTHASVKVLHALEVQAAHLADEGLPDVVQRQRAAVVQRVRALQQLRRQRCRHLSRHLSRARARPG